MLSAVLLSACSNSTKGEELVSFAICLTDSGAVMYGTDWCPHCKDQKEMFGKSFNLVNYVDCDRQKDECLTAGIQGYPTWIINDNFYTGTQDLKRLASLTQCELPE